MYRALDRSPALSKFRRRHASKNLRTDAALYRRLRLLCIRYPPLIAAKARTSLALLSRTSATARDHLAPTKQ